MTQSKNYLGFLKINYEDGDASTYNGIELLLGDDGVKKFSSGDPLIDWYEYCKYIYNGSAIEDNITSIIHSSSVDHWFMDTDEYIEKYIEYDENTGKYDFITTDTMNILSLDELRTKLRCVVAKDMKTFQDLKDYYEKKQKII